MAFIRDLSSLYSSSGWWSLLEILILLSEVPHGASLCRNCLGPGHSVFLTSSCFSPHRWFLGRNCQPFQQSYSASYNMRRNMTSILLMERFMLSIGKCFVAYFLWVIWAHWPVRKGMTMIFIPATVENCLETGWNEWIFQEMLWAALARTCSNS